MTIQIAIFVRVLVFLQYIKAHLMPSTLGIKIDGIPLTDEQAKLIALYIMGLSNKEISGCLFLKPSYLRNLASALYGLLDSGKSPQGLARRGERGGFDGYGHSDGIDVLSARERRWIEQNVPRLALEKEILLIKVA